MGGMPEATDRLPHLVISNFLLALLSAANVWLWRHNLVFAVILSILIVCLVSAMVGVDRRGGPIAWGAAAGLLLPWIIGTAVFAAVQLEPDARHPYYTSEAFLFSAALGASLLVGLPGGLTLGFAVRVVNRTLTDYDRNAPPD